MKAIERREKKIRPRFSIPCGPSLKTWYGRTEALETDVYFAHPYASWERGTNENTNGLLRQYFPKKRKLNDVSKYEIKYVENRLNHRPRKKLGFKTPYEVFFNTTELLTVALRT